MKVAFTGHRPQKLGGFDDNTNQFEYVVKQIHQTILQLEKIEPVHIISGMALGVDQWAAEYAAFRKIPFSAYVPCEGQDSRWPQASRDRYNQLLALASEVKLVTKGPYSPWKMQERNKAMVDDCDVLIAVWDGTSGGTKNCVDYALNIKKRMIRIPPYPIGGGTG